MTTGTRGGNGSRATVIKGQRECFRAFHDRERQAPDGRRGQGNAPTIRTPWPYEHEAAGTS
jgi:hypothetical protein